MQSQRLHDVVLLRRWLDCVVLARLSKTVGPSGSWDKGCRPQTPLAVAELGELDGLGGLGELGMEKRSSWKEWIVEWWFIRWLCFL